MKRLLAVSALCSALLATAAGCGFENEGSFGTPQKNGICSTGAHWSGGASSAMTPGMDCVGCHASNEGPNYAIAGTVFKGLNDEDTCLGVDGITVTITDTAGHVYTTITNGSGNFAFHPSQVAGLTPPFHAEVSKNGVTRAMSSAQTAGGCNTCHSLTGANGAPGRILAP